MSKRLVLHVRILSGRFSLLFLFWVTGVVVLLTANVGSSSEEVGGGFSVDGLNFYEKYQHGFPFQMLERTVWNRESSKWKIWDADQFRVEVRGLAVNLLFIGVTAGGSFFLMRKNKGVSNQKKVPGANGETLGDGETLGEETLGDTHKAP